MLSRADKIRDAAETNQHQFINTFGLMAKQITEFQKVLGVLVDSQTRQTQAATQYQNLSQIAKQLELAQNAPFKPLNINPESNAEALASLEIALSGRMAAIHGTISSTSYAISKLTALDIHPFQASLRDAGRIIKKCGEGIKISRDNLRHEGKLKKTTDFKEEIGNTEVFNDSENLGRAIRAFLKTSEKITKSPKSSARTKSAPRLSSTEKGELLSESAANLLSSLGKLLNSVQNDSCWKAGPAQFERALELIYGTAYVSASAAEISHSLSHHISTWAEKNKGCFFRFAGAQELNSEPFQRSVSAHERLRIGNQHDPLSPLETTLLKWLQLWNDDTHLTVRSKSAGTGDNSDSASHLDSLLVQVRKELASFEDALERNSPYSIDAAIDDLFRKQFVTRSERNDLREMFCPAITDSLASKAASSPVETVVRDMNPATALSVVEFPTKPKVDSSAELYKQLTSPEGLGLSAEVAKYLVVKGLTLEFFTNRVDQLSRALAVDGEAGAPRAVALSVIRMNHDILKMDHLDFDSLARQVASVIEKAHAAEVAHLPEFSPARCPENFATLHGANTLIKAIRLEEMKEKVSKTLKVDPDIAVTLFRTIKDTEQNEISVEMAIEAATRRQFQAMRSYLAEGDVPEYYANLRKRVSATFTVLAHAGAFTFPDRAGVDANGKASNDLFHAIVTLNTAKLASHAPVKELEALLVAMFPDFRTVPAPATPASPVSPGRPVRRDRMFQPRPPTPLGKLEEVLPAGIEKLAEKAGGTAVPPKSK